VGALLIQSDPFFNSIATAAGCVGAAAFDCCRIYGRREFTPQVG